MEKFMYGRYGIADKNGNYKWYIRPMIWEGVWKPIEKDCASCNYSGFNDGVLINGNVTAIFDCEEWAKEHCEQLNKAVEYEQIIKDTIKFIDDKCIQDEPIVIKERMLKAMKGEN